MTDTWAAKVLEGVPRHNAQDAKNMTGYTSAVWLHEAEVLAAIAKLGAGDGLVERATAALEGVTDGPWAVECKYGTTRLLMGNEVAMCDEKYYPWTPENDNDWHFIAFTRQWVPEAADRIAALTAQVAELEACLERQVSGHREDLDEIAERAGEVLERLQQRDKSRDGYYGHPLFNRDGLQAAALITALLTANAALRAQVRESALQELASLGQAQEVYEAQKAAKAEAAALRAKLARIASAWPIVRDADCSGGTLASAMDEIEAAISDGAADE